MRAIFIAAFAAAALLGGCSTIDRLFGVSSVIEDAAPAERPALRVIEATLIVKGAYQTVEEQLDQGRLTIGEAQRLKNKIDAAAAAVKVAGEAVASGGDASALILADELIDGILDSGLIKGE